MFKNLNLARMTFKCSLLIVSFVALAIVGAKSTHADQNGTGCPDSYLDISNHTVYLNLDTICDAYGNPVTSPYQQGCYTGICDHDACYNSPDIGGGTTTTCTPCPSSWQNCTPCDNYANNCSDPPDPQPTPTP